MKITTPAAMDGINLRMDKGVIRLASDGVKQNWRMNRGSMTPAYTSNWDELPVDVQVSVKVTTSNAKINKEISAIFKSYEQKPQAIVDANSKEIWYIDTVNRMNSKSPDWFSMPEQTNKVVGYGVGNSHEEAMHSARKELAYTVRTTISASTVILQNDNTFRSYSDVTQRVSAVTEAELNAGDYSVYKQIELDGKYYIALCYRCSAK